MGAGQSAEEPGHSRAQEVKTSYYKLLGVNKTATDDDIKKAYRRKALSLHPDRNYGREGAATTEFAAVQSAYEVLSDPQERAWYDSHEEAILRDIDPTASAADGGAGHEESIGLTSADDVTRLLRRFHGGVEFDDSPSGFFGFLRDFFEQLAKEEEQAARRQDGDVADYPSFGHKADTHNDGVRQFYGAWSGFSTVKSFAWRDKYRASDAEDRRMRRLIEKENLKCRKDGIAEFNDAIRSLVAFVKKRDPRYTPNIRTEAERQKILQDASKAQAARMRAANDRARQDADDAVPVWARNRAEEEPVGQGVEEGAFEESSSEEEHFECMACRKTFKSEKQYEAHEKSNKHKKAVQALKKKLRKEGQRVGLEDGMSDDSSEQEDGVPPNVLGNEQSEHSPQHDNQHPEVDQNLPRNKAETGDDGQTQRGHNTSSDNDDELTTRVDGIDLKHPPELANASDSADSADSADHGPQQLPYSPPSTEAKAEQQPKKGKAALKREKKAAKAAAADAEDLKFKCAACAAAFPSKTRLFQHLRDFGHAAPPAQGKYKQPSTAGKKKKDRNI